MPFKNSVHREVYFKLFTVFHLVGTLIQYQVPGCLMLILVKDLNTIVI